MAEPAYSFTIPSLKDDIKLDCRVYRPRTLGDISREVKAAVVAHPYAPLGGCYDDPVVASMTETLLQQGYVVGTFNFRYAAHFETLYRDGTDYWTEGRVNQRAGLRGLVGQKSRTTSPLQGS